VKDTAVAGCAGLGVYKRIDGTRMKIRQSTAVTPIKKDKTKKLRRIKSLRTIN
jgi:hypothetical protein